MRKTISAIVPAARSIERTQELIDSLYALTHKAAIEPIISSPNFTIARAINLRDDMIGPARVQALALKIATGNYVAWLTDKCFLFDGCLDEMMMFLDGNDPPFIGQFKTGDFGSDRSFVPHERSGELRIGDFTLFGHRDYIPIANWGMASRETIDRIGYFAEEFSHDYSDVDLSLRCWQAGGRVDLCESARMVVWSFPWSTKPPYPPGRESRDATADKAVFWARWPELAKRGIE